MIAFLNKNTGEIKYALSVDVRGRKTYVSFSRNSRVYVYNSENIKVLYDENDMGSNSLNLPFIVYVFRRMCYRCFKGTDIITYIVYDDDTNQSIKYPWNKQRLLKNQKVLEHIFDPSIEYYGIKVIGDLDEFDDLLMKKFENKIQIRYSSVTETSYPMNICEHCGAPQGNYYVYRLVNEMIKNMENIDVLN